MLFSSGNFHPKRLLPFLFLFVLTACGGENDSTGLAGSGTGMGTSGGQFVDSSSCNVMEADFTVTPFYVPSGEEIEEGPAWTMDGERLVYVNHLHAWEYTIATGEERCITCDFGEITEVHRAYPMVDGSFIIAAPTHQLEEGLQGIHEALSRFFGDEIWWIDGSLEHPPVPLGARVFEGFGVSQNQMKISWASSIAQLDVPLSPAIAPLDLIKPGFAIYVADLEVANGSAELVNISKAYEDPRSFVEVQDFLPDNSGVTFSTYWSLDRRFWPEIDPVAVVESGGYIPIHNVDAEAWTLDFATGEATNQTDNNDEYDEWEGIHPSGQWSFMETTRDGAFDLYISTLDGQQLRRISDLAGGGELMVDPWWHPNGKLAAVSYSYNPDPQRVIETHPAMALIEFDCE